MESREKTTKMSNNNHNFQCFNAEGEGSHKTSLPLKHHTSHLPRIPQHGMVAHHLEECYLCSEYRHAQAMEALDAHVSPLCHIHAPYHHHPHHQYVVRGPTRPEEAHSGHGPQVHHHRHNKRVTLVKNSEPSFRKTIVLHRRNLRSFCLFLEEVSELMQYHIRKLCTLEGRKIDSVQSLMLCPRVLVCVGREPSHPSIMENFLKTSHVKLPKLRARLSSSGWTEGHEGPTEKSVTNPKPESDNRSNRQSVTSDKSLPDGTYSPDNMDSCPASIDAIRDEDIEKRVHVNKDGSLSMEMKVRFRLQNDETLHWSTKVTKTTDTTFKDIQRDNNTCFAQVSERLQSELDYISPSEQDGGNFTRNYQRHAEEPHCPHCCTHCQEYDIWKNVPATQGAGRRIQTSSSSASSHTVSTKMVVERKTMSRSSDEHSEQVVETETCVKQTVEAAETVEFCTIRREANSPKTNRQSTSAEKAVDNSSDEQIGGKKEEAGHDPSASSQILTVDKMDNNDEDVDVPPNVLRASTERGEETDASEVGSPKQHLSPDPTPRPPDATEYYNKPKKPKSSHICRCRVSNDTKDDKKGQRRGQAGDEGEMERDQSSAISVKSNGSGRSNKTEDMLGTQSDDVEEPQSKSAMSLNDVTGEEITYDKETHERLTSSMSVRSSNSVKSELACEPGTYEEDINDERVLSSMSGKSNVEQVEEEFEQMSARSNASAESKHGEPEVSAEEKIQDENFKEDEKAEETGQDQYRGSSVMSSQSDISAKSTHSKLQGEERAKGDTEKRATSVMSSNAKSSDIEPDTEENAKEIQHTDSRSLSGAPSNKAYSEVETVERAPSTMSVKSLQSNASMRSTKSKNSKRHRRESSDVTDDKNAPEEIEIERPQSTMSVKTAKSDISAKSSKSFGAPGKETHEEEKPRSIEQEAEARTSSAMSEISVVSKSSEISSRSKSSKDRKKNDEQRSQSPMSGKSAKLNASVISVKSTGSQVLPKCDDCDKGDSENSERSISCMSDKSAMSRSSKTEGSEKGNITEYEKEMGSRAPSVKSTHSNVSAKSTQSNISAQSTMSKPSFAKENAADHMEKPERTPSNLSLTSVKSEESNISGSAIPSQNDTVAFKNTEESERRSVSSMSVQSVASSISARSNKSKCSAHVPAKESFECSSEEKRTEKRSASGMSAKSVQSRVSEVSVESAETAPSLLSAKSAKSHASTKSYKSAACDSEKTTGIADEGDGGDETQDRSQSAASAKSVTSNFSAKSEKTIYSADVPANERSEASDEGNDKKLNEERAGSSLSVKSIHSAFSEISIKSKERAPSSFSSTKSVKSNASVPVYSGKTTAVSDGEESDEETQERAQSAKSMSDHFENEDTGPSNMSVRSAKSTKSSASTASKKSKGFLSEHSADVSKKANKEEHDESRSASSVSVHSVKSNVSASSKKSKCSSECMKSNACEVSPSTNTPKGGNRQEEVQDKAETAMSVKSTVSVTSNESKLLDNSAVEDEQRSSSVMSEKSAKSAKSDASGISEKSKACDVHSEHSTDGMEAEDEERMSLKSAQSTESKNSARSKMSTCCDVPAENDKQTEERVTSSMSDRSAQSHEGVVEQTLERTTSSLTVKSARSNSTVKSVTFKDKSEDSAMSAKSDSSDTSAKACLEEATEEPSESIMSVSVSSRGTSACEGTSERNVGDGEETVQRPPSTLSVKSARSAKSTQSNISNKLQTSNTPGDESHTENMERASSSTSIISTKSTQSISTAISKESKASDVPAEDCGDVTDTGETERRATSSVSAKSFKSNVTSVSTKSKVSHSSPNVNNDGDSKESKSATSVKSDTSARTMKSSVSGITPCEMTRHEEQTDESPHRGTSTKSEKSNNSTKSNILKTSNISAVESSHNEENAEKKSERAPSTMSAKSTVSVRSEKYKVCDGLADSRQKEGRTPSAMSANSNISEMISRYEVPALTVEKTEEVLSSKSKASAHSKKNKKEKQSEGQSHGSLSVKSDLSMKSRKSKVTDNVTVEEMENKNEFEMSTAVKVPAEQKTSVSTGNKAEVVDSQEKSKPTSQVSQDTNGKRNCLSKRSRQDRQIANASSEGKSETCHSAQPKATKHHVMCHAESNGSDLSQTLSSSDVVKEMREIPVKDLKSTVTEGIINGPVEDSNNISDNNTHADTFDLVPSSLPNASPTEVVNEWLKRIPTESDMFDMEELGETCEADKTEHTTEETQKQDNNDPAAEKTEDIGVLKNSGPSNECHTGSEAPNQEKTVTQRDDASNVFHSSVQVMKVLLNPKLDRCNSSPEVSPVYGRKLSNSAKGLLDCLVKLQLIDHDPKNANEMAKRYQELMNILQSLWLCDPPETKQVLEKGHRHSVDNECNHTSSSGVDVNSGSTGSGKSSDGVKTNDGGNRDAPQPVADADMLRGVQEVGQEEDERTSDRKEEGMHEEKQKEDDPATDDTIRSNDSPREVPETPSSSNKGSENDSNGPKHSGEVESECPDINSGSPLLIQRAQLAKRISQDPDPVWVLKLLSKIEEQFMTHYIDAMREFKVRWNLDDNEQLDMMISELETEVRKRIQKSIDRELRKIQGRAGLPRPPKETMSRASTTQTEERRRRLKIMVKQSIDTQTEKSNDSATGTSYSDQRSDNDAEFCPCETCIRKKGTCKAPLPAEGKNTAPVILDFDLKRILVMKNSDPDKAQELTCASHAENYIETTTTKDESAKGDDVEEEKFDNEEEMRVMGANTPADDSEGTDVADESDESTNQNVVAVDKETSTTSEDLTKGEAAEDEEEFANEAFTEPESNTDEAVDAADEEEEIAATIQGEKNEEADDVITAVNEYTADDVTSMSKHNYDESDKEELMEEEELEDGDSSRQLAEEATNEDECSITCKGESKEDAAEDEIAAETTIATTENESDQETASGEESASASEDDSAEDFTGNEAAEENCATGNMLSKEPAEEAITEDEHALETEASEDVLKEEADEATTIHCKSPEETLVVTASEYESAEAGTGDFEEELASTGTEESAYDNYGTSMAGDASEEPSEEAETGDEVNEITKEETAESESSVAATTENESDKEEADDGEKATSDNKDDTAEDEATGDELPVESTEVVTTEDGTATDRDTDVVSDEESKTEFSETTKAENANAAGATDGAATTVNKLNKDDAVEIEVDNERGQAAHTSDEDGTTDADKAATAEHESATDKDNALTGEDSSAAEEADDADTTERDSAKDAASEEEIQATSANESESDEQEINEKLTIEYENGRQIETAVTSEDEMKEGASEATTADNTNAVEDTADTTENESDEEEAANEAEDGGAGLDATTNNETAEENENTDEAAVGKEAVTTDDTDSEAENMCEEQICPVDESTEEEMEESTGGEPVDEQSNAEANAEPASEENYKGATDNESEEESYESATDENKSENNAGSDANEPAREEDISNVSNDNESGDEHSEDMPENETVGETEEEEKHALDENKTFIEKDQLELASAKELQETEPSENTAEQSSTVEDDVVSHTDEPHEAAGDESEEAEYESEAFAEDKSETEAATTGDESEEHETAAESGEPEVAGNETTEGDAGEECGTHGESDGDGGGSAQEDRQQITEGENEELLEDADSESETNPDKAKQRCKESDISEEHQEEPNAETEGPDDVVELRPAEDEEGEEESEEDAEKGGNTSQEDDENDEGETNVTQCERINIRNESHDTDEDNVHASEKEEEGTEPANENSCGIEGDSADGEDEAEEDSDGPEKESDDEEQDLVSGKTREKLVLFNRATEETTLMPLNTLATLNTESEDGAYADVEDSETEINSQEDRAEVEKDFTIK